MLKVLGEVKEMNAQIKKTHVSQCIINQRPPSVAHFEPDPIVGCDTWATDRCLSLIEARCHLMQGQNQLAYWTGTNQALNTDNILTRTEVGYMHLLHALSDL